MKDKIVKALEQIERGKRKFRQSVELVINFKGVDFSKPENRVNATISLPNGRGAKKWKVGVIGDENFVREAEKAGADKLIRKEDLDALSSDSKALKELIRDYTLLAQPQLMGEVAKKIGKFLGPRNKMPKPVLGKLKESIEKARNEVRVATKGKNLPVLHAFIGTEDMSNEELAENAMAVYEELKKAVGAQAISKLYVKFTMSKAVRV
ncbi:MAG: hypothetical protein QW035_02550 [Candidatus Anstonellales archaeon]